MKKIVALILVVLFAFPAFSLTSCGSINDADVAILWSYDGVVKAPDSLINSMERAMYIESISYTHYGADGDSAKQLEQANDALNGGCAALLVELVSPESAQTIVDAAKAKEIPVVFFNSSVEDAVVDSYDKCVCVSSDASSVAKVQGEMIGNYVVSNYKNIDRNGDGKISYVAFTDGLGDSIVETANAIIAKDKKANGYTLELYDPDTMVEEIPAIIGAIPSYEEILGKYNDENNNMVELVITNHDFIAFNLLIMLQEKGYNTDKLNTHLIPIFTVGASVDYKAIVLSGIPDDADANEVDEYYETMKYVCDLTVVEEEDLEEMIYNTANVIDAGRLAGTALENKDAIAEAVAKITRNFIKEDPAFDKVESGEVNGSTLLIGYTVYPN